MWDKFTRIYSNTFIAKFGEEPCDEWAEQLRGVSMTQLERGFNKLREEPKFETFPPNPIEFYCLCIGRDRPQLDSDGNDASWQHKQIEAADRVGDTLKLNSNAHSETVRQKGRATLNNLKELFKT